MKRIYLSPESAEVALDAENALLGTSDNTSMPVIDDPDEGFNKDNNFSDWLSNKKRLSETEE